MRTLLLALLIPAIALADVDPKFGRLRDQARPLETSFAAFLDKYVGDCGASFTGSCKEAAEAFRKTTTGQRFYVIIPEEQVTMLQPGPFIPAKGEYTVLVTPFFAGGGYALTEGAPRHTDMHGNPVLPVIALHGTLPDGWDPVSFQRLFHEHALRLQLIFTPLGTWVLKGRRGKLHGVRARLDGLLITYARTGDVVASYFGK